MELLEEAEAHVEEIQSLNSQLLGALAASVRAPETGQQICILTDRLQQLATRGDAAFSKAQGLVENARDSSADGVLHNDRSSETQSAADEPESLADVVALVREISGLDIQCVTYVHKQSSLMDSLTPILGVESKEATEVWVVIKDVMRASVALQAKGQPEAITLAVYSANEQTEGRDAWGSSRHQTYRRISAVCMRALHHFQQQVKSGESSPARAFLKMLLWLCSYRNLLSAKCEVSKTALAVDTATQHLMPPILRPFRLSMDELKDAASPQAASLAYHMHSAPGHLL